MIQYHIDMITKGGYDPIVILLIIRSILSVAIAVIFYIEPRKCGGRNRLVHWLLATTFMLGAWSAWVRANARMGAIAVGGGRLSIDSLLLSEIVIVTMEVIVIVAMVYQEFNAKEKEHYKLRYKCEYCEYRGENCIKE